MANKIILRKDPRTGEDYSVYRQSPEGGTSSDVSSFCLENLDPVDGHFFIIRYHFNPTLTPILNREIVGVAHNKEEIQKKKYECAVQYCQTLVEGGNAEFVDETRAKESPLATKTGSSPPASNSTVYGGHGGHSG